MIASWPGPDPAIHGPEDRFLVDHRVKPGDDGFDMVMTAYGSSPVMTTAGE